MLPLTPRVRQRVAVRRRPGSVLVFAAVLLALPVWGAVLTDLPGRAWTALFEDEAADHYATALALSDDGGWIWLGGTTRKGFKAAQRAEFWVWKVDERGRIVSRLALRAPGGFDGLDGAYPYVRGLTRRSPGGVYAIVEFEKGRPTLVTVTDEGKLLSTRPLAANYGGAAIHKVIEISGGGLFAVGEADRGGYVCRLAGDGKTAWEKRFAKDPRLILLDAATDGSDGLVVIGNYGTFNEFGVGPVNLWLARIDAAGNVTDEVAWPGRTGSVATREDGGFLVVYDKSNSAAQDVRMRVVDSSLTSVKDEALVKSDLGLARFRIVRLDDGDFVVAGSRQTTLWVAGVTAEGDVQWSYTAGAQEKLWTADALGTDGRNVYLVSSVMGFEERRQQRELSRDVGLLKFAP